MHRYHAAPRRAAKPSRLLLSLVARLHPWMRRWWANRWQSWRSWSRRGTTPARMHFESFEPRILMSADLSPVALTPTSVEQNIVTPAASSDPGLSVNRLSLGAATGGLSSFTDADGTTATVQINGPGTGSFEDNSGVFTLHIDGSTAATTVRLLTSGGDGRVVLGGVDAAGAVGTADLGNAALQGLAQFGAGVGTLRLASMANASVVHNGSGMFTLEVAGDVSDSELMAAGASVAISAQSWGSSSAGASRIDVAALRSVSTTGDFNTDLGVNGIGVSGYVLSSVQIGGAIGAGHWNVVGRANLISAQSTGADWHANVTNTLAQLLVRNDASGWLSVAGLQMLQVGGSLRGLTLLVGADLGAVAELGGSGANADSFKAGTLARVRVTGDIVDSRILVSVDPVNGVVNDGNDRQLGTATQRLQELIVGGHLLGSTSIVAPAFPATVKVGGATLAPAALTALSNSPKDVVAPVLSAALAHDTGASASDGVTNDPSIAGQVVDAGQVAKLWAALDPLDANAPLTDVSGALLGGGALALGRAALDLLAGGVLADGAHTLRLVAEDAAGNKSNVVQVGFTLDTAAPSAAFGIATADSLNGLDNQTAASIVQITGQSGAGTTVSLAAQGLSTLVGSNGNFQLAGVALLAGDNAVTLTFTDASGNSSTLTRTLTQVAQTQSDAILTWNRIALNAVQLDVTDPPIATRTLAMVSLAQYDALAAIEGTPAYLVQRTITGPVSAQAAAAVAAHRILSQIYPAQRGSFDAALASSLAGVADGAAKDTGIALGLSVADAVLAARANDGSQAFTTYPGSTALGEWRPTGPMYEVADEPNWKSVQPFALASPSALRPPAPPALDTAVYAASVEEIKRLGSATSTERTADQTQQALFWADGAGSYTPPGHWNQIAAEIATVRGNSLSANARLFAQLNVALADAAIACWDAKYTYGLWRPVTAIQNAADDSNPATTADEDWRPFLITPPHPEYVSGHSTFSSAAATVLAATFGDNTVFSTTSATLPGVTRSFTSFTEAAQEAGRSRVYGGIHYEFTNQAGLLVGAQVAHAVLDRFALQQDTQAPTVALANLASVVNHNPTFTGQVLDNLSGVQGAQYRVDSGALQDLVLAQDGSFSITTVLATDGSAEGDHSVTIVARDAAGNTSANITRSFRLDTIAPTLTLTSLAEGAVIVPGASVAGIADATGSTLTQLNYRVDGGPLRSLAFDSVSGSFSQSLATASMGIGNHTILVTAQDAAGNIGTLTRNVEVQQLAPFMIVGFTPADGVSDIGVTVRPLVIFSRAVNTATLTADSFYATAPDGSKLAATIVPSADSTYAWLFFTDPMPGGARITLNVNGAMIRAQADGAFLDGDGDGLAGGSLVASFTTVSRAAVTGTKIVGKVVDPGLDLQPMTFDDMRRGPDGIIHTSDDVFLNPIAGAKVYVLGQEDKFVLTDADGNFELDGVPA
ncbi:MAG: Ig-like domain-containing protein, partial [Burkholderiaceae bacterium]